MKNFKFLVSVLVFCSALFFSVSVMSESPGAIIVLNGTSTAGKTTTGKILEKKLKEIYGEDPVVFYSLDEHYARAIDEEYCRCNPGEVSDDLEEISKSEYRKRVSAFFNRMENRDKNRIANDVDMKIGELAKGGMIVITDPVVETEELWLRFCWRAGLIGLRVYSVLLYCPLDVLWSRIEERNKLAVDNQLEQRDSLAAICQFIDLYRFSAKKGENVLARFGREERKILFQKIEKLFCFKLDGKKLSGLDFYGRLRLENKIGRWFRTKLYRDAYLIPERAHDRVFNTGTMSEDEVVKLLILDFLKSAREAESEVEEL